MSMPSRKLAKPIRSICERKLHRFGDDVQPSGLVAVLQIKVLEDIEHLCDMDTA